MAQEEEPNSANPTPDLKKTSPCEECKENPSKYTCPGCSTRSCCLLCVKAHKRRTGCTGQRQKTQFVPLSQFDDNLILSDYTMLEDVKRATESAQRTRLQVCGSSHFRLPFPLKSLRSAAASRRTKLLFLSSGMSKRVTNRSFYNNSPVLEPTGNAVSHDLCFRGYYSRKKFITWTIEWRFHSTDAVLIDHGVHEDTNLSSVLENHLKPGPWNHRLKQFCEEPMESLRCFIRKYPKGRLSPYREFDIKAPIREQLANLVIMEYPVIHVFLPSHSCDFEIVKDSVADKPKLEIVSNCEPSPMGVPFRVEEIEEDSASDPRVLDLMKHVKRDEVIRTPFLSEGTEKESDDTLCRRRLENMTQDSSPTSNSIIHEAECDHTNSNCKTRDLEVFESMDFEFDPGLVDAYSDLISEINTDDFLDLEGVFNELDGRTDQAASNTGLPAEEELEEGEIPGC
ncbi:hypothetical protein RJ639_019342 [Escallonia herrerae]|uniref:HIT-type domain-containing protein n=1 Tax=Escallonia herrerae TaxID=1293975 RepID=A0AA88VDB8_9ASTE|nr:hypothetical protein RJ639_019342 [Escallonia herrerae]